MSRRASLLLLLSLVFAAALFFLASTTWALAQEAKGAAGSQSAKQAESGKAEGKTAEGEDETEQFKQSPSVRGLARLLGMDPHKTYWASVILNFAVIALAIFFLSKMHLPSMFRDRTAGIRKAMEEARHASEDAKRRLAEIEARLGKLDSEISAIRASAESESAAEEQCIRAVAEEDKKKIVEAAEQEIAAAAKSARRDLTAYAADLAVTLASKRISVDDATDQRLVHGFAQELGSGKDGN